MPGPLDALKSAYNWATTSVIPKQWSDTAADYIDSPSLERSPMAARAQGFGAGALQGLSSLATPLNLASLAMGMGGAGKAAGGAAEAAGDLSGITPDLVQPSMARQMTPGAGDVDALIGGMRHSLAKIPSAGTRTAMGAAPSAEMAAATPEAEAAYNAIRPASQSVSDPMNSIYQQILASRGGLGSEAGKISPEMAALTGLTGAGLAYGAKKAYDTISGGAQDVNKKVNPFQIYSDKLNGGR